jgi:hypothetical protein
VCIRPHPGAANASDPTKGSGSPPRLSCASRKGTPRANTQVKSNFTDVSKIVAGRGAGRSVCKRRHALSKFWSQGFHTGGPKTPAPKNVQHKCNSNSNTYMFMKYKYNIVYTNK